MSPSWLLALTMITGSALAGNIWRTFRQTCATTAAASGASIRRPFHVHNISTTEWGEKQRHDRTRTELLSDTCAGQAEMHQRRLESDGLNRKRRSEIDCLTWADKSHRETLKTMFLITQLKA